MEQELGRAVTFVPHLVPLNRGILETIYARVDAGHDRRGGAAPRCEPRTPTRRSCACWDDALPEIKHVAYTHVLRHRLARRRSRRAALVIVVVHRQPAEGRREPGRAEPQPDVRPRRADGAAADGAPGRPQARRRTARRRRARRAPWPRRSPRAAAHDAARRRARRRPRDRRGAREGRHPEAAGRRPPRHRPGRRSTSSSPCWPARSTRGSSRPSTPPAAAPVGLTGADAAVAPVEPMPPFRSVAGETVSLGLVGQPVHDGAPHLAVAPARAAATCRSSPRIGAGADGALYNVNADTMAARARGAPRRGAAASSPARRPACSTRDGPTIAELERAGRAGAGRPRGTVNARHARQAAGLPRGARGRRGRRGHRGRPRTRRGCGATRSRGRRRSAAASMTRVVLMDVDSQRSKAGTCCRPTGARPWCSRAAKACYLFDDDGQALPRPDLRRRRGVARPRATRRWPPRSPTRRATLRPHVEPLLPPAAGPGGVAARVALGPAAHVLLQQRHRGDRRLPQVRAPLLAHRRRRDAHGVRRARARVPRPDDRVAVGDVGRALPRAVRAAAARTCVWVPADDPAALADGGLRSHDGHRHRSRSRAKAACGR